MITTQQAIEICKASVLSDYQMLEVIQKYIFDKKGIEVDINRPRDLYSIQLMNIAFTSCCDFYLKNN